MEYGFCKDYEPKQSKSVSNSYAIRIITHGTTTQYIPPRYNYYNDYSN